MKKFNLLLFLILIAGSCEQENKTQDIIVVNKDSLIKENSNPYEQYSIPLPIDLFKFLEQEGIFQPDIVSPLSMKEKYTTQLESALLLGVFTADLAYCTVMNNGQNAIYYSEAASYFANRLSIEDAYGKPYVERLEKNIDNVDSLKIITSEAYAKTCVYLEQKGVYNVLPFVVYGAWIESLYLIINSDSQNIKIEQIKNKLLNEYKVIEKIITYMYDVQVETSAYNFNNELKVLIKNLDDLSLLFDNYSKSKSEDDYKLIVEKISFLKLELNP